MELIKLTTSNVTYESIQYNIHVSHTQSIKVVISVVDRGHHEEQFCVVVLNLD